MSFKERALALTRDFKRELRVYTRVLKDRRTPPAGKVFLGLAIGYLLMPFDLIPDFIPVLGQLDDIILVPLLVILGLRCIPKALIEEIRAAVLREEHA
jgi:uncharacterized membrane protein YkvA (DUF1232 family)